MPLTLTWGAVATVPTFSDIVATPDDTSCVIEWNPSPACTGQVQYSESQAYDLLSTLETNYLDYHRQTIGGLLPGTTYHFRIYGVDAAGMAAYSDDQVFSTTGSVTVPPPASLIYGSGIQFDTLNGSPVGSPSGQRLSWRWRATYSGAVPSFRYYFQSYIPGYGGGTGGTHRIDLCPDDGTSLHAPVTGTVLATSAQGAISNSGNAGRVVSFSSPYTVTAGVLYHFVWTNTDSNPAANWFSPNDLYNWVISESATGTLQPRYADVDWAEMVNTGSGWLDSRNSRGSSVLTPICEITYANGSTQGVGYMEVSPYNYGTVSGSSHMVRQLLTPTQNLSVVGAYARVVKVSGSDVLTIRIEDNTGAPVASGTVSAASFPFGTASNGDASHSDTWGGISFSAVTLTAGTTYRLRLSTASSSTYAVFTMRKGTSYGYTPAACFADGYAQQTTDGTNWGSVGNNTNVNDIGFYLVLA